MRFKNLCVFMLFIICLFIFPGCGGDSGGGSDNSGKTVSPAIGALDMGFSTDGKVTTPVGSSDDEAKAIAIQSDGKIVAAGISDVGGFVLVRYNTDGSLDESFGTGGIVTTPIGSNGDGPFSIAIQSDGKIVAAGYSNNGSDDDFALVRYNTDGSLDTGFSTDGKVTTPVGSYSDCAYAITIQSDGKIVAAGSSYYNDSGQCYFALVRYNTDGSLDTGFGTGGKVTTTVGSFSGGVYAITMQSDGKIVAAGYSYNGVNLYFALVRYNTDGSLDTGFGTGGKVITSIGSDYGCAYATAIQSDGKIVAAGYSYDGSNFDFALVRYNTDGSPDTGFGTGGIVTTPIGNSHDFARAIAIQSDGKIVAAGYLENNSNDDFALVRYNTDGSLDTGFGTGGIVTTNFGGFDDQAYTIAIQSDGKIVAAGYSNNGSNCDFAIVRYK